MSDKLIPENGVLLKSRYDCYNNQKRCDKADNNYSHELEFVPENYKTEIMKNKVVNNSQSALQFVPKQFVAKVIRHKKCMIKLLILMSKYCFDRYKTQLMWNKIVDNFQSTSKLISDQFVTNKMLGKVDLDHIFFVDLVD